VDVGGVELCLESFGNPADPALLLIGGATSSMDWWEVGFCERLAGRGLRVIRYDQRDTGRSTSWPAAAPTYTWTELATDPLRLLDALGVERAHLAGVSMGGGVAQVLAARHRERLLSITLMATTAAGDRVGTTALPPPEPRVAETFTDPPKDPDWSDRTAVVDQMLEVHRLYAGAAGFDEERVRRLCEVVVDRSRDVEASVKNHWVLGGESITFRLADLDVPTLVLHGTDDPMFPLPHGEALAAEIPGATLVPLEGMGHEVPPRALWDVVIPEIVDHTA